jgi:AraC-like DNA-binding protein
MVESGQPPIATVEFASERHERLLAHTDLPAAGIAAALGFSEATNFGKFFTREAGLSPGAFRRRGV